MVPRERTFARLRFTNRNAGLCDEFGERFGCFTHQHATPGDNQRPAAGADSCHCTCKRNLVRLATADKPHPLAEELFGIIVCFGLHVLRKRQRRRAAIGGRREHTHHLRQCGDELLGTIDAIPVARHRLEAVVDADVLCGGRLDLLQHGRNVAAREDVAGQQKHGQAINSGQGRAGDHVCGAGADGRGACKGAQAIRGLGIGGGHVHTGLLVAHQDVLEVGILLQSLPDTGHVAVTEDAEHAGEECVLLSIPLDVLIFQEKNQGLRHCQATRSPGLACCFAHFVTIGRRGSLSCHVPRTHA